MKLTPKQEKYLEAVEWLINYDSFRLEGRSFLLAYAFVRRAMSYPGEWVLVFDHYPHDKYRQSERMMKLVWGIISENEELLKMTEFREDKFKINLTGGQNEKVRAA